jgi:hypothetical protein
LAVRTESVGVQRIRKENSVFVASNNEELQNLSVTHIPFDATDARAAGTLRKIDGLIYCPGVLTYVRLED